MLHGPRTEVTVRVFGTSVALAAALVGVTAIAGAHDFWLVAVGDELHGVSGSRFPVSDNKSLPLSVSRRSVFTIQLSTEV